MDLGFNETQQMLKNIAREVLVKDCPPSVVREMEEDARGYTDELWKQMADLGWLGLALPEEYGGAGGDFVDLAALLEEMGRALMPGPFFSTVVLGSLSLLDAGSESVKRDLLPKIASGHLVMTLANVEASGTHEPQGIQTDARLDGDEYVINGTKLFTPDAHVSDLIIVATRTSSHLDPTEGISLLLVPRSADGVQVTSHKTLASDKQCQILMNDVRVPLTSMLGEVGEGWPVLERALQRATAAKCVEMSGGAQAVLDMTLQYLKHRVQFGRPIGTFQGLQHHSANMATAVEACRYMSYQAAWRVAQGLPALREISMAKAWVSEAYPRVCALAHQCHGAIGFTREHDLQLYSRRARQQEQSFGDSQYHRKLLAANLGD